MDKIMLIVGARPQFIKAAPVVEQELDGYEWLLVHTGQHYDYRMSRAFFEELSIPTPDRQLEVGPMAPAPQIAKMIERLWDVIQEDAPAVCAVFGDTNSTLAGALAADLAGVPLAHVEAGLRSGDMKMPEERNRVITDKLSDVLVVPHERAADILAAEGATGKVIDAGDTTYETALKAIPLAEDVERVSPFGVNRGEYVFVTCHRQATVDDAGELRKVTEALFDIPLKVVFPVHPRTEKRLREFGLWDRLAEYNKVTLTEPAGYITTLALIYSTAAVITDSGGIQREAYLYGVPTVTLRDVTEWTETVDGGGNTLAGTEPEAIKTAVRKAIARPVDNRLVRRELVGDPKPSKRIADALSELAGRRTCDK
ncbi:MAG: UDP-N-acetylglucosamine 2-epimerase (non-hydrolyzing) [Candidatus Coatesbacteria bacterium]|nr:MAG: UDP-N-acetylglucosamine 2-epimerase (non-hydrolyzing) [Candidatus Coatesbacteria bacterium]